jgi:hypothetical protein
MMLASPGEAGQRLDEYEKELAQKVEAEVPTPVKDYGAASDLDHYALSSEPAFTAAASVSHEAIGKLTKDDAGTQTADMKKTPQPFSHGVHKFQV